MNGSIRKRGEKSWELTIDLGRDVNGKRQRKFLHVKGSRKEADKRRRELLTQLDKGKKVETVTITIADLLDRWLEEVSTQKGPSTVDGYKTIVRTHLIPALGNIRLSSLNALHIERYYKTALLEGRRDNKGGLSPRTVHHHHWVLSAALKYARRKKLVAENVLEEVDPPKPVRYQPVMLSPKEVERLLEAARKYGSPYHQLIYTAIYSGLRRGELLGARWRDVNLDLATLMVVQTLQRVRGEFILKEPKTAKSRRNLALTPNLAILLRQHKEQQEEQRALLGLPFADTDLVFSHHDGSPLDPSTVSHTCKKIVTRAGLESRLHDNRHAFATLMMSFGVNPKVVSEMLGHSTIATTMDTYSHVSLDLQRNAAQTLQDRMEKYRLSDTVLEPSVK